MANLPDVYQTFKDGGLGVIAGGAGKSQVKLGMCTSGLANTFYSFADKRVMRSVLGDGPLVELMAQQIDLSGGPVYAVVPEISAHGSVTSSFALTGTGSATVSASAAPHVEIIIKCTTGGALGTAAFTFALGGAAAGAPVVSAAGWASTGFRIPGTLVTATFAAGTYVLNETCTLKVDDTITAFSTSPAVSATASPVDHYRLRVEITTAGALGTAAFRVALDGGRHDQSYTWGPSVLTVAGGVYAVPGTGVVLTFAGTFVAGDVYTGKAATASFNTTNLTNALNVVLASAAAWEILHVAGLSASASDAAAVAAVVETAMASAETGKQYVAGVIECPTFDTSDVAIADATIQSAFSTFTSPRGRTSVVAGDVDLVSQITGRCERRNLAWAYCVRLGQTKRCEHPGKVALGALPNVKYIYRDEAATPGLDASRFVTSRTFKGKVGYFITRGRTMAASTSDFSSIMNVRVMNLVATTSQAAYLEFVNADVRVDLDTGYIDARDADHIDAMVNAKLSAAVMDEGEASGVSSAISRTDNILSTSVLHAMVSAIPKGYAEEIGVELGFVNPALAA